MARTAVIAGTATAVSGRVARRQQGRYEQQQQQAMPPPPPPPAQAPPQAGESDDLAEIQQLAELHAQGILTDDEFAAKKAQILGL
jgi:hypothetical protein